MDSRVCMLALLLTPLMKSRMKSINRQKQYSINKPIDKVQAILSNLKSFAEIHPLILAVYPLDNYNSYTIKEKPYPWLPIKVNYKARVSTNANEIVYEISELPLTTATIKYQLYQEIGESTIIDFHLQVNSKMLGKKILVNKMMKAQDAVMEALEKFKNYEV